MERLPTGLLFSPAKLSVLSAPLSAWNPGKVDVLSGPSASTIGRSGMA